MKRQNRMEWARGATVSLAASVGLLVGLRTVVAFTVPRFTSVLTLPVFPREGLGVAWSVRALWPAELQEAALERILAVLIGLVLAAVGVGVLNAFVLLAESSSARRRELAIRGAVGAPPAALVRRLVGELRTLSFTGVALGLLLGLSLGGAVRALWPGAVSSGAGVGTAALSLVPWVGGILVLLVLAHVGVGIRMGRGSGAMDELRAGTNASATARAVFFRRAAPAVHTAAAGAVLLGAVALGTSIRDTIAEAAESGPAWVIDASAPGAGAWDEVRTDLADIPGVQAESLASPGALLGLGVRDYATAQCGPCSRGGMPAPLWGAFVDHHSVTPGYFELAGVELMAGRDFGAGDVAGAESVAIVSETFARTSFHKGEPIGRRVRVGSRHDAWYTVVGVVADVDRVVLGADELPREALYLVNAQQPSRSGSLVFRASGAAATEVANRMEAAGFDIGEPRPLSAVYEGAMTPLLWLRNLALGLAGVALLLAAHGVHSTALQVTRRRRPELAIRRALGATDARIVRHVLGERVRVSLWGAAGMAFWGTFALAALRRAAGIALPGPGPYLAVLGVLVGVAVVASTRAAGEALSVPPARAME